MDSITVYPDGTDKPGVNIPTLNGFVARVVSAVSDQNIPDAQRVAQILNAHQAEPTWRSPETAPEDEWVLISTTGNWVGEAILDWAHKDPEDNPTWRWAMGAPVRFEVLGWMPLPRGGVKPAGPSGEDLTKHRLENPFCVDRARCLVTRRCGRDPVCGN